MPKLDLYFENLAALVAKLDLAALTREPLQDAVQAAVDAIRDDALAHRPRRAAREKGSPGIGPITTSVGVERAPGGVYGTVAVGSLKSSFRVPQALNYAKVRYHYRATAYQGRSTRGWFTGARTRKARDIRAAFDAAMAAIGRKWGVS